MGKGKRAVSETMSSIEETANKSSSVTSNDHVDSQSIDKSDSSSSTSIGEVLKKGPWTSAEDEKLKDYVRRFGEGNWNNVKKFTGLNRCGKSCRLRWSNHLRPGLKKGSFSPKEEEFVIKYHYKHGSKWAHMAGHLRGRTDNEIKNFWNTRVKRLERDGKPIYPPELMKQAEKEREKENGWNRRNIELNISDTLHVGRFEIVRGNAQQLYEHDDLSEENISPPQTTYQIPRKRSSTPQGCDDSVSSINHSEKRPCIGTSGPKLEQVRRVCSYMNYSSLCLALPSVPDRSYLPTFGSIISGKISPLGDHLYSPQPLSETSNEELPSLQNSVFETGPTGINPPTWCPSSSAEDGNDLQPSTSAPKFSGLLQDVVTESQLKHSKSSIQSDRISPDDQTYVIPETYSPPASTLHHVSNYHDNAILSTADGIHGNSKPPSTSAFQSTGLLNDVIMKPQLIYSESFAQTDVISETNCLPSSSLHHVSNSQNNAIPSAPAVDMKLEARSAISVPEQIFEGKQPSHPDSIKTESLLAVSTFEDPDGIDLIPMYFGDDYLGVEDSLLTDMQYLTDWPAL